ncbi:ParA family protein [Aureimonas sp. AU12]|uniref:ParA family protein n=1 Tax=Aureimonas sp. AU12 TaxID=1638161 RepID=UPI0009EC9ACB|nr:ParA family protein [Aureimonas sp. AU12]
MPVISFVSSKGGVGKTTGAVILAGELALAGKTVAMVDADPNEPLVAWSRIRDITSTVHVFADASVETIIDTIDDLRSRFDFVIIDLEGRAADRIGFAMTRSDLVLIPVQGSLLDANEAAKSVKLIRQMSRVTNRDIPYRVYFSRLAPAIRERTLRDIEDQFAENKIPTLSVSTVDRAAFRAMFSLGGTLHDLDHSDIGGLERARENAVAFAQSIISVLVGGEKQ